MSKKTETLLDLELHKACRQGDAHRVQHVLNTGRVHVDCHDKETGETPLMLACAGNHRKCVEILVKEGAEVDLADKRGVTSLMVACRFGLGHVVADLVRHGADVDAVNQDGGTALMFACQFGWSEIVNDLLQHGCNLHKAMQDGTTALFLACQGGHDAVVKLLIDECIRRRRNVGILLAAPRKDGASPLFIATQMNQLRCVQVLLAHGAEVDQNRVDDVSPMFKACQKGYIQIAQELVEHRAKVGVLQNGESCLHAAAVSGNPEMVKFLLRLGTRIDPNVVNRNGKTPFDLASEAGHHEVAKLLEFVMQTSGSTASKKLAGDKEARQVQQVRFAMDNARRHWRQTLDDQARAPLKVRCKMVHTGEREAESKTPPITYVWKHSLTQLPDRA